MWIVWLFIGLVCEQKQSMLSTYYRTDTYTSEAYVDRTNSGYIIIHYVNNVRYTSRFNDITWNFLWSLDPYLGTGKPIRIRYSKEDPSILHPADMKHVEWALLLDGIIGWIMLLVVAPLAINEWCINPLFGLYRNPEPPSKEEEFDINNLF